MKDQFKLNGKVIAEVIKDIDGEYFIRLDQTTSTFLNLNQTKKLSRWLTSMNKKYTTLMFKTLSSK